MDMGVRLAEAGLLPDLVIRAAIRARHAGTLRRLRLESLGAESRAEESFLDALGAGPVAVETQAANDQHYELPPEFFAAHLGPRMKYSAGFWPPGARSLPDSELAGLDLMLDHAGFPQGGDSKGLGEGLRALELGCGWGSLSLRMAERFPAARILAVSNSAPQIAYVAGEAARRGADGLTAMRANMVDFNPEERFDRIVSVEMFEHLRNWPEMFRRVASWLAPGGTFTMHVFCHAGRSYLFEAEPSDWMATHFFTGGMMPSVHLAARCQEHLVLEKQWLQDGRHYQRTCEAWLARLDENRDRALSVLAEHAGRKEAATALQRWRMFYMACAELFGFESGRRWFVAHYRFRARELGESRS